MKFEIKALRFFQDQIEELDEKSRRIIRDKIQLVKQNPYRYKRVRSKQYSRVFRVRFSIGGREVRMIYVLVDSKIILVCLLDRKRDYKDLEKYLDKLGEEA